MSTLSGKNAMVLGGSRGIGAATVERLVNDGASVTFTYHGSKDAADAVASKTGATAVQADSGDREALAALLAQHEGLDILVVSAGIAMVDHSRKLDPAKVDRMIDVNVRGPYHASVEASRVMNEGGRIVVIGSVNADRIPFPGGAAYAMTKSALQGMVQGLARDFGAKGITVNNIQPGPVDTDMNPKDGPMKDVMHQMMAIQRHARADEVAAMVAYLVGPEAGMVTGASLTIDGGLAA
ncbi:MAG: SDR family oxidoreductase [Pseudomonadota bacterium]